MGGTHYSCIKFASQKYLFQKTNKYWHCVSTRLHVCLRALHDMYISHECCRESGLRHSRRPRSMNLPDTCLCTSARRSKGRLCNCNPCSRASYAAARSRHACLCTTLSVAAGCRLCRASRRQQPLRPALQSCGGHACVSRSSFALVPRAAGEARPGSLGGLERAQVGGASRQL